MLIKNIMAKRQLRLQKLTLVARIRMMYVMIIITMTRRRKMMLIRYITDRI